MSVKSIVSIGSQQGPAVAAVTIASRSNFPAAGYSLAAVDTGSDRKTVAAALGDGVFEIPQGAAYFHFTIRGTGATRTLTPVFEVWGVDDNGLLFPLYNAPGNYSITINGTIVNTAQASPGYASVEASPGQHTVDVRGARYLMIFRTTASDAGTVIYGKFESR